MPTPPIDVVKDTKHVPYFTGDDSLSFSTWIRLLEITFKAIGYYKSIVPIFFCSKFYLDHTTHTMPDQMSII